MGCFVFTQNGNVLNCSGSNLYKRHYLMVFDLSIKSHLISENVDDITAATLLALVDENSMTS